MPQALQHKSSQIRPLPMSREEVAARGWDCVDVVFVTGDAYVDHPSFAMAILGRTLEAAGYRVAILSQPDWHSCDAWRTFGRPRLCFAVSAGNLDSMLNHYTAAKKVRNDDAYSPGGQIGRRPDRATLAYCQRAREAYPGVPVVAGGVEASLRRLAHYDYWSDKVRRSILLDSKADLLVFGMGEKPLLEVVAGLAAGKTVRELREIRGTAYRLGASEAEERFGGQGSGFGVQEAGFRVQGSGFRDEEERFFETDNRQLTTDNSSSAPILLPSYEEVAADKQAFCQMTRLILRETNPYNARPLVQFHGREAVVVNPPAMPMTEAEIDRIYGLPFTRKPHPSYGKQTIPALAVVKDSIQIMRGCFGGCAFCSLTAHQGRVIQSRSQESVLAEIARIVGEPGASGVISDIGGPTANMYRMGCSKPEMAARCRRLSCLYPKLCPMLRTDHGPLVQLMRAARRTPGVKQVLVASGVRMDLARLSPEYVKELAEHHTGGLLKVAPEHVAPEVLACMHKTSVDDFRAFEDLFQKAADQAAKPERLIPYFLSGHPGCDLPAMIRLAQFLKQTGYRPDKVQDFIPLPMDVATCMYHTGIDPTTGKEVYVPRGAHERRLQRALLQFWKPENYDDVREALVQAGREDLIGYRADCLIADHRPHGQATPGRPRGARPAAPGRNTKPSGYRPFRKSAKRRDKGRG